MFDAARRDAYLARLGITGTVRPDPVTLREVHRRHLAVWCYENLDIQLGRPIELSPDALFAKFVVAGRGGFCFENNGLLLYALRAIGFDAVPVAGAVHRESAGDGAWRNHVVLSVTIDGMRWIADTGLGDGFLEPLPLREGVHRQGGFSHRLDRLAEPGRRWRCRPDPHGSVRSFDIDLEPLRLEDFGDRCRELSTAPDSPFVTTLTVQRPTPEAMRVLRGRTLTESGPAIRTRRLLADRAEFVAALTDGFGLGRETLGDVELDALWRRVCRQHEDWTARHRAG